MSRARWGCLALVAALLTACGGGSGGTFLPPPPTQEFRVEQVTAANFAVRLAFAPDGRLFFNELRTGNVRIVQNGVLQAQPFVSLNVETAGERGLLGIALDPAFASNGFVYLYYSAPAGVHRLVRYRDAGGVGTDATVLVDNLPSTTNHNGGNIGFGADGKLYLSVGDNQDPANSQDQNSVSGKILRFNPDGSIPADNPFGAGNPVFAMGLRNSFDFTFHPQLPFTMFASENGPNCDDEINRIVAGGNYGWRPSYTCGDTSANFTTPVARINPVIAPTGLLFYSGSALPLWTNTLFLVDFVNGRMQQFFVLESGTQPFPPLTLAVGQHEALLDIAQAPDGSIYFSSDVAIFRIVPD
jgi:glucose/arabinose dehydrogenase